MVFPVRRRHGHGGPEKELQVRNGAQEEVMRRELRKQKWTKNFWLQFEQLEKCPSHQDGGYVGAVEVEATGTRIDLKEKRH